MAAVGWKSARVVGVSFGGMVAQELAIRHPHVVERLVLACTSPGGDGGASFPLHELSHLDRPSQARHMIPIADRRHDSAWMETRPESYEALLRMASADPWVDEPGYAAGRLRQLEARAAHDVWARLGQIRCPTLVCGGRYDGIAPPETQEKLASRIQGATLRLFEGGHLFLLQDRDALPAIVAFLEDEKDRRIDRPSP
jgi:3-oxoadipate enol-lactonase